MKHSNTQKYISNVMLFVIIAGIALLSIYFTNTDDDFSVVLFLIPGLLASILGLIFYFIYRANAYKFDKIVNGNDYLAKWHIDGHLWSSFIEKDRKFSLNKSFKSGRISLFIFIPMLFICYFLINDSYSLILLSAVLFGSVVITTLVLYIFIYQKHHQRSKLSSADVILTEHCLIINSEFYDWSALGNRFENIKYLEDENMLRFTYSVSSRSGRIKYDVNVPFSKSEENQLKKIMEYFSNKI